MQSTTTLVSRLLMIAAVAGLIIAGCTEEEPVVTDETPPRVEILNPTSTDRTSVDPFTITDSIVVTLWAEDASGVQKVELWCTFHGDSTARRLAELAEPDSGGYYSYRWNTNTERTGAAGVLWAVATDGEGNEGRTESDVSIRIVNSGNQRPLYVAFSVSPSSGGKVDDELAFNPSLTRDDVDDDSRLLVRWNFGDGTVIDTTANRNASEVVYHTYTRSDTFVVRLTAWNTYYPASDFAERTYYVQPAEGIPDTLVSETVDLPAGTYPIGVTYFRDGEADDYSDREFVNLSTSRNPDTLFISLTSDLRIDKYEVTNELYVNFLNAARDSGLLEEGIGTATETVRGAEGNPWIHLKETGGSDLSRIIFFDDETGFAVSERWKRFPVTGVTWYGAKAYANFYGRRLPTEYEWEAAARAGHLDSNMDDTHVYPWVDYTVIANEYANFANSQDPYDLGGSNLRAETPVGAYSAEFGELLSPLIPVEARGPFGTYDQAGNVSEWVEDWYMATIYDSLMAEYINSGVPPADPPPPARGDQKITRGGDFMSEPEDLRVTYRRAMDPASGNARTGFRTLYTEFN